jgi:hypothetical protein
MVVFRCPSGEDGATIVVVFYTKPNVSPNGPLAPRVTINITLPDGRTFDKLLDTTADKFAASKAGLRCTNRKQPLRG